MAEIKRVELERDNDQGVHEIKRGERLDPVDPEPPANRGGPRHRESGSTPGPAPTPAKDTGHTHDQEEFERATTPFPGADAR